MQEGQAEALDRFEELKRLRAIRRAKSRGQYTRSFGEVLSNPLLPPWMSPSSIETASPLGADLLSFSGMDVRETKRPVANREYPAEISGLGSSY